MANKEIRMKLIEKGLKNYEVAAALGIGPEYFSRKMRYELSPEEKEKYLRAIDQAAEKADR